MYSVSGMASTSASESSSAVLRSSSCSPASVFFLIETTGGGVKYGWVCHGGVGCLGGTEHGRQRPAAATTGAPRLPAPWGWTTVGAGGAPIVLRADADAAGVVGMPWQARPSRRPGLPGQVVFLAAATTALAPETTAFATAPSALPAAAFAAAGPPSSRPSPVSPWSPAWRPWLVSWLPWDCGLRGLGCGPGRLGCRLAGLHCRASAAALAAGLAAAFRRRLRLLARRLGGGLHGLGRGFRFHCWFLGFRSGLGLSLHLPSPRNRGAGGCG